MNIRRIAKRIANRYLYAKDECSGIKDIHKYVKCRAEKIKEDGADEGAAFGTAWSIACKHKRDVLDPKNEVCSMPPSGYLKNQKKKTAGSDVSFSLGRKRFKLRYLNIYADRYGERVFITVKLFYPSNFGESTEEFAVEVHKGRSGRMEYLESSDFSLAKIYKDGLELNRLFSKSEWYLISKLLHLNLNTLIKRNHKNVWHGYHNKGRLRTLPSGYGLVKSKYNILPEVGESGESEKSVPQEEDTFRFVGEFKIIHLNIDMEFSHEYDVAFEHLDFYLIYKDHDGERQELSFEHKDFAEASCFSLRDVEMGRGEYISKDEVRRKVLRGKGSRKADNLYNSIYFNMKGIYDSDDIMEDVIDAVVNQIHRKKNSDEWLDEIEKFCHYLDEQGLDI